jgi:hypothetical protein
MADEKDREEDTEGHRRTIAPDEPTKQDDKEGHGGGKWSGFGETEDDTEGHRRT